VSALTAKAKLAGMWREKLDQHNTGSPVYERIERIIVERPPQWPGNIPDEISLPVGTLISIKIVFLLHP
jgi:hypothetical protein